MIAAITGRAFDVVRAKAPAAVDVRRLPCGLEHAAFVVLDGEQDPAALDALPRLETVRVVQTLSAGTDWIEPHMPSWATLCNARGARDIAVAEWVLGALLGDSYGQLRCARGSTSTRASCTGRPSWCSGTGRSAARSRSTWRRSRCG